jgi:hypothetical protein
VKGINLLGLVKVLRSVRKKRPLAGLSPAAELMLGEQILVSDWYPYSVFIELMEVTFREVLRRDEDHAREMGIAGGRQAVAGLHRQFVKPGDPGASLLAMRLAWRVYFDFGELTAHRDGPNAVRFVTVGYRDMPPVHGQMIVGWHMGTALEAGAVQVDYEIIEAPWRGAFRLEHRISY